MSYQSKVEPKTELKAEPKASIPTWVPRQGELDLAGADRWQQFPGDDREACRQALAELLYQVITTQPQTNGHER